MVDQARPLDKLREKNGRLRELIARVRILPDPDAMAELIHELASRLVEADKNLPLTLQGELSGLWPRPRAKVLPAGGIVPLSRLQAKLLGAVEAAGNKGIDDYELLALLWPRLRDSPRAHARLRKLTYDTNAILKKYDPKKRRIQRPEPHRLFLKLLPHR
jgi:hypothetical protein